MFIAILTIGNTQSSTYYPIAIHSKDLGGGGQHFCYNLNTVYIDIISICFILYWVESISIVFCDTFKEICWHFSNLWIFENYFINDVLYSNLRFEYVEHGTYTVNTCHM